MRLGRKTRTGLGLSLGVLAGIAMILLPGLVTATQAPLLGPHGLANGNNTHSNNSTVTTPRSTNDNSTGGATTGPTTVHTTNSNASAANIAAVNYTITGSTTKNPPPGSVPTTSLATKGESGITMSTLALIVSTIIVPALGLSFIARNWSIRQAKKGFEEHLEL